MKSAVGRDIPTAAAGYGPVAAFAGAFQTTQPLRRYAPLMKQARPGDDKVLDSLAEAFQRIPVKDGMTLSFHHHFRNGDGVLNQVLAVAASLGRKNLNIMISSIFPVHAPLIDISEAAWSAVWIPTTFQDRSARLCRRACWPTR